MCTASTRWCGFSEAQRTSLHPCSACNLSKQCSSQDSYLPTLCRRAGMAGVQQNSSAIFITLLVITLMPFCYMSLFVADKQFFKDDPAQSLYTSIMYYLSIVSTNAIVSTMNGVIIMLIIYSMLSEFSPLLHGL